MPSHIFLFFCLTALIILIIHNKDLGAWCIRYNSRFGGPALLTVHIGLVYEPAVLTVEVDGPRVLGARGVGGRVRVSREVRETVHGHYEPKHDLVI